MWISFTKISSFTIEGHLGSNCGMIREVLKMIAEELCCKTLRTLNAHKRCILSKLQINQN